MTSTESVMDRNSTLFLIDDNSSGTGTQSSSPYSTPYRPRIPSQSVEWRPWLQSIPSTSSTDEYTKPPITNQDYSNFPPTQSKIPSIPDHQPDVTLDIHVIRSCHRSLPWWGKLFSTLLLVTATMGLAYQLYNIFNEFIWNRSISGSYKIQQGSVQFPDIYICPTNPINETYRREHGLDIKLVQLLSILDQKSNQDGILGKQFVDWDYTTEEPDHPNFLTDSLNYSPLLSADHLLNPFSILENLPSSSRLESIRNYFIRIGYEMNQFLIECSFASKPFECSEFAESILDRKHGKCFLFPFNKANLVNQSWTISNGAEGFSAAINIHTELYPKLNGTLFDGLYLYFDWKMDPSSSIFQKPIFLSPGAYSILNFESKSIRISKSISGCIEEDQNFWKILNNPGYYTENLCKFDCILQSILDQCHCLLLIDDRYINQSLLNLQNYTDQFSRKIQIGYCAINQLNECVFDIIQNYGNCHWCKPACTKREYTLKSSSYMKFSEGRSEWNEMKKNYILVDIVMDKGENILIEEEQRMNLEIFLGIVGGQMSLFLGCSLITLIQVIVIFITFCRNICKMVCRGKCLVVRGVMGKMRNVSLLR